MPLVLLAPAMLIMTPILAGLSCSLMFSWLLDNSSFAPRGLMCWDWGAWFSSTRFLCAPWLSKVALQLLWRASRKALPVSFRVYSVSSGLPGKRRERGGDRSSALLLPAFFTVEMDFRRRLFLAVWGELLWWSVTVEASITVGFF